MADQTFFTSSENGLADYSGFQFVAVSSGTSAERLELASRYLGYKRPPGAPPRPTARELADFPVAFGYVPTSSGACFTQCRYLGPDYSGRPGNFLGMAVIASIEETDEARPIEMWKATWWTDAVPDDAPTRDLLPLRPLEPGAAVSPADVADLVVKDRSDLLASLIDAVMSILDGDTRSTVVVAEDPETIVAWFTAISYSLSFEQARQLSFVTYSGEPDRARYQLVGTTPSAWNSSTRRGRAFLVDDDQWQADEPPSGYARALSDCWREGALARLDDLVETTAALTADLDGETAQERRRLREDRDAVAALVQLAAGHGAPMDVQQVLGLLHRRAPQISPRIWRGLSGVRQLPTDLAMSLIEAGVRTGNLGDAGRILVNAISCAIDQPHRRPQLRPITVDHHVRERISNVVTGHLAAVADLDELGACLKLAEMYSALVDPAAVAGTAAELARAGQGDVRQGASAIGHHRNAFLRGVVSGLEQASEAVRRTLLTSDACDTLAALPWSKAPRVGRIVLRDRALRLRDTRVDASQQLARLRASGGMDRRALRDDLAQIWAHISIPEFQELLDSFGGNQARQQVPPEIVSLASRAWMTGGLAGPQAQTLARAVQVLQLDPFQTPVAADAELVCLVPQFRRGDMSATMTAAQSIARLRPQATEDIAMAVISYWIRGLDRIRRRDRARMPPEGIDILVIVANMQPGLTNPSYEVRAARQLIRLIQSERRKTNPKQPLDEQ